MLDKESTPAVSVGVLSLLPCRDTACCVILSMFNIFFLASGKKNICYQVKTRTAKHVPSGFFLFAFGKDSTDEGSTAARAIDLLILPPCPARNSLPHYPTYILYSLHLSLAILRIRNSAFGFFIVYRSSFLPTASGRFHFYPHPYFRPTQEFVLPSFWNNSLAAEVNDILRLAFFS